MIPQPNWKKIFAKYAAQGMFEFPGQQDLCQAGLAFVDYVADRKRMKDIEFVGIAESKTFVVWVHIVLSDMEIDQNDYLEVKRIVFAVQGSQGVVGWES